MHQYYNLVTLVLDGQSKSKLYSKEQRKYKIFVSNPLYGHYYFQEYVAHNHIVPACNWFGTFQFVLISPGNHAAFKNSFKKKFLKGLRKDITKMKQASSTIKANRKRTF